MALARLLVHHQVDVALAVLHLLVLMPWNLSGIGRRLLVSMRILSVLDRELAGGSEQSPSIAMMSPRSQCLN